MKRLYICTWGYFEDGNVKKNISPLFSFLESFGDDYIFEGLEGFQTIDPQVDLQNGKPVKAVCIHIITGTQVFFDWLDANAPNNTFIRIPKMNFSDPINSLKVPFRRTVEDFCTGIGETINWDDYTIVEDFVRDFISRSCPGQNFDSFDWSQFNQ